MENGLQIQLIAVALLAIPVLIGVLVYYARPTLLTYIEKAKEEIGTTKWEQLEQYGRWAVQAAEQTLELETNEAKKAFVVKFLKEQAEVLDIPVTEAQLDTLIESIVYEVKNQWHAVGGITINGPEFVDGPIPEASSIKDAAIEPA